MHCAPVQADSRKLLPEAKAKSNEKERRRFDLQAAKILKEKGNHYFKLWCSSQHW
jgi:hypothetical protein